MPIPFKKFLVSKVHALQWIVQIATEFYRGFHLLAKVGPAVTIFGSARLTESNDSYMKVLRLSQKLAEQGFAIITGGGPGIMEAANRGAQNAGGLSIGWRIHLVKHEPGNRFVNLGMTFQHFFIRKVMLTHRSQAVVVAPGGFGTLDELFEIVTLVQTGKLPHVPIYLLNKNYWQPLVQFIGESMLKEGTISPSDRDILQCYDDPEEILAAIRRDIKGTGRPQAPAPSLAA
jgi:uncharacterized protein (TIGR00730 family)